MLSRVLDINPLTLTYMLTQRVSSTLPTVVLIKVSEHPGLDFLVHAAPEHLSRALDLQIFKENRHGLPTAAGATVPAIHFRSRLLASSGTLAQFSSTVTSRGE